MKTTSKKPMRYIIRNKEILGGAPTIKGTRIPAERLEHLVNQGYREENIRKEFPGIRVGVIRGALSELVSLGVSEARRLNAS